MLIWVCVAVRIIANPLSNVFQKVLTRRSADPLVIIAVPLAILSAFLLPVLPYMPIRTGNGFWPNLLVCTALAVAGNTLLVYAVRIADLSVLGPINAYKSVVSLVPGMILLGEFPRPCGLLGIGFIVVGSLFIVDHSKSSVRRNVLLRFFSDRGVQFRFAALILSAIEAVYLKRAVLASTPWVTFVFWCLFGCILSLVATTLLTSRLRASTELAEAGAHWRPYASLAATTGLMQITTLVTFRAMQVGYSLALFQTSTLISVILGNRLFNEKDFLKRFIGSMIMIAGAVLIIASR